jgi:RimJ/RimL family protein N-acetyltransferase
MFPDLVRDDVFRLETARLWLAWPRACDAPAIAAIAGRREVAEMTARIPHPYPPSGAEDFVFEARNANVAGTAIELTMRLKNGRREIVGLIGARLGPDGVPALGYIVDPSRWGQGLATEAMQAVVAAVFTFTAKRRIAAEAMVANPASCRVLAKAGFEPAGSGSAFFPARGCVVAVNRFSLERREWHQRVGAPRETVQSAGPLRVDVPIF